MTAAAGRARWLGALRAAHLFTLALWLGGGVCLFAAVAPAAFSTLPNTKWSGAIVGQVIAYLDWLALGALPLWLGAALWDERARASGPRVVAVRVGALSLVAVVAAVSRFVIVPRMDALRAAADYTGVPGAPWSGKAAFGALHGWSSGLMLLALLAGVGAMWFAARRERAPAR